MRGFGVLGGSAAAVRVYSAGLRVQQAIRMQDQQFSIYKRHFAKKDLLGTWLRDSSKVSADQITENIELFSFNRSSSVEVVNIIQNANENTLNNISNQVLPKAVTYCSTKHSTSVLQALIHKLPGTSATKQHLMKAVIEQGLNTHSLSTHWMGCVAKLLPAATEDQIAQVTATVASRIEELSIIPGGNNLVQACFNTGSEIEIQVLMERLLRPVQDMKYMFKELPKTLQGNLPDIIPLVAIMSHLSARWVYKVAKECVLDEDLEAVYLSLLPVFYMSCVQVDGKMLPPLILRFNQSQKRALLRELLYPTNFNKQYADFLVFTLRRADGIRETEIKLDPVSITCTLPLEYLVLNPTSSPILECLIPAAGEEEVAEIGEFVKSRLFQILDNSASSFLVPQLVSHASRSLLSEVVDEILYPGERNKKTFEELGLEKGVTPLVYFAGSDIGNMVIQGIVEAERKAGSEVMTQEVTGSMWEILYTVRGLHIIGALFNQGTSAQRKEMIEQVVQPSKRNLMFFKSVHTGSEMHLPVVLLWEHKYARFGARAVLYNLDASEFDELVVYLETNKYVLQMSASGRNIMENIEHTYEYSFGIDLKPKKKRSSDHDNRGESSDW